MTLIKTSLLNGIAAAVKIATALVLNKILAIYVGPGGYAVIGQLQNVISIVISFAGGVVASGVTKTTAQYFDDEGKQHTVWQTAIRLSLFASLIAGTILLFTGKYLAEWLLHRDDMSTIFIWLALVLPAMAANNLLMAIVNGKKEIGIYVSANIIGSLSSLLVLGLLAYYFGLYGALVAFTINPAIVLISTALLVARRDWFKARFLWGQINRPALHDLYGFGLMGLTSALTVPTSHMLIRDHLATNLSLTAAGYWQSSWKISEIFLMLVTTTLSVYYLPRLAEIRSASDLKNEIIKVYRFVMPIVAIGAVMIYLLRDFIIHVLFTPDFSAMRELFLWQLVGDVIRVGTWIVGYVLISRGVVKVFLSVEIIFSVSFVLLSRFFVNQWGFQGIPIAYALNYLICWFYVTYWVVQEIRQMKMANG